MKGLSTNFLRKSCMNANVLAMTAILFIICSAPQAQGKVVTIQEFHGIILQHFGQERDLHFSGTTSSGRRCQIYFGYAKGSTKPWYTWIDVSSRLSRRGWTKSVGVSIAEWSNVRGADARYSTYRITAKGRVLRMDFVEPLHWDYPNSKVHGWMTLERNPQENTMAVQVSNGYSRETSDTCVITPSKTQTIF